MSLLVRTMSISIYQVALEVAKGVMVKPESARSLPIYLPTVARKHDSFLHYHEDALAPALRTRHILRCEAVVLFTSVVKPWKREAPDDRAR